MKSQQERAKEKAEQKRKDKETMWELFQKIWRERPQYSEVSWVSLGKEISSIYFHHILPKRNYEEAKFDEENIILLTGDEHANVENDIYRYEEINKRREKLLEKYG